MNQIKYHETIKKIDSKPKTAKDVCLAFLGGGLIGVIGQSLVDLYRHVFSFTKEDAITIMILTVITLTILATGLGVYDKVAEKLGGGLFVPITGFANSLSSAAIDCRNEGFIYGIGANIFKLAGSVILYGTVIGYIGGMIRYAVMLIW